MERATDFLDDESRKQVEDAVARAEERTAAEIACVVATESGRYDRAESLIGLLFGLVGLAGAEAAWGFIQGPGSWGGTTPTWAYALGVVLGFVVGSMASSFFHPLRHLLVSGAEAEEEVDRSAAAAFTRLTVGSTASGTGVLVYVSLAERRVVVLLDSKAREAAGEGFASELCAQAIEGLRDGKQAEVLVELVDTIAERLAEALPRQDGDRDELPNHVVVLHPR